MKKHKSFSAHREVDIAIFASTLDGGGAERVVVTLANGFVEQGRSVDVVLAKARGAYLGELSETVRIVNLDSSRILGCFPGLVRYLRGERPTALLSVLNPVNVLASIAKKMSGSSTHVVASVHENISASLESTRSFRSRIVVQLMRRTLHWADGVVAVSQGVKKDLVEIAGLRSDKIHVIYNPVLTREVKDHLLGFPDHPWFACEVMPVILGVGRLAEQKDFSTLLHAFAMVRARRDARLVILGEGPQRSQLEELIGELDIESDVELPGFVRNPYAFMRHAAVFVLSSRWEGFGNVLAEAMSCGTAVISTDCPSGPAEILQGGRWGRLVPVGNVVALAEAIDATLDDSHPPDVASRAEEFKAENSVKAYLQTLLPHDVCR